MRDSERLFRGFHELQEFTTIVFEFCATIIASGRIDVNIFL